MCVGTAVCAGSAENVSETLLPASWERMLSLIDSGHVTCTRQRYERGRPVLVFWAQCSCSWVSSRIWNERKDAWELDAKLHRLWSLS
jgi:hypothetical protein